MSLSPGDDGAAPSAPSSTTGSSRFTFGKKSSRLLIRASAVGRLAHTSFSTKDLRRLSLLSSDSQLSDAGVLGVLLELRPLLALGSSSSSPSGVLVALPALPMAFGDMKATERVFLDLDVSTVSAGFFE